MKMQTYSKRQHEIVLFPGIASGYILNQISSMLQGKQISLVTILPRERM